MREIEIIGDIAIVTLTKGHRCVIDAKDVSLVSSYSWYAEEKKTTVYAKTSYRDGEKYKSIFMHRLLLRPDDGKFCDHIDHDGLNNRRSNLRVCTIRENLANSRLRATSSSGYKGVYWEKDRGKWRAQIGFNGKKIKLGRYDTPEEAHKAYVKASQELYGEFSCAG